MALIKCNECGHMVSDKASACPHCGNPINRHNNASASDDIRQKPNEHAYQSNTQPEGTDSKGIIWICVISAFVLVGILSAIAVMNVGSSNKSGNYIENAEASYSSQDGSAMSQLNEREGSGTTQSNESAIQRDTIVKNGEKLIKVGAWSYWNRKDPMTDQITYLAVNQSKNMSTVANGSTYLYLTLTYTGKASLIGLAIESGTFRTEDLPMAYVRFDQNDVETYSVMVDTPQAIYIPDYDKFMSKLKSAKKIAIQVECADGRKSTFTFDNTGLEWHHNKLD